MPPTPKKKSSGTYKRTSVKSVETMPPVAKPTPEGAKPSGVLTRGHKGQPHYCRACEFRATARTDRSAHEQIRRHQREMTKNIGKDHCYLRPLEVSCSKDCTSIERTEEVRAGVMLYGNGMKKKLHTPEDVALMERGILLITKDDDDDQPF